MTHHVKHLTWDGPNRHVQIATKHGKLWTRAWGTDVPGLVVVYDTDNDRWTLTHQASGRAVLSMVAPIVSYLRLAALRMRELDWTVAEEDITDAHRQAKLDASEALVEYLAAMPAPRLETQAAPAAEVEPAVTPDTDRGVASL